MSKDTTQEKIRSNQQNKSLHLYLTLVSDELTNMGVTMQDIMKVVRRMEIAPTPIALKETIWKPCQDVMLGKKSTTELTTAEVNEVYEIVAMFFAKYFKISIPFPAKCDKCQHIECIC